LNFLHINGYDDMKYILIAIIFMMIGLTASFRSVYLYKKMAEKARNEEVISSLCFKGK